MSSFPYNKKSIPMPLDAKKAIPIPEDNGIGLGRSIERLFSFNEPPNALNLESGVISFSCHFLVSGVGRALRNVSADVFSTLALRGWVETPRALAAGK